MLIRRMMMEDVEQVAAIEAACFSRPWSQGSFEDAVSDINALFLVAVEEEEVLGYIGMYLSAPEGEITNVAVAPDYRGKSIGKALVKEMQSQTLEDGINRIVLEVRVSNAPAITTYEHVGFENLGVRKNFYDLPTEDAFIMAWER